MSFVFIHIFTFSLFFERERARERKSERERERAKESERDRERQRERDRESRERETERVEQVQIKSFNVHPRGLEEAENEVRTPETQTHLGAVPQPGSTETASQSDGQSRGTEKGVCVCV